MIGNFYYCVETMREKKADPRVFGGWFSPDCNFSKNRFYPIRCRLSYYGI
jgi:hypothetical protein